MENQLPSAESTQTPSSASPHGVHLVGSVPLSNSDEVFQTASSILGKHLQRIPDGETGERHYWIGWQFQFLASNPHLEVIPPDPADYAPLPHVKLRTPVEASAISFERIGYADAAKASYDIFARLKKEGKIPTQCRFQVSLPTPLAPITQFVISEDQAVVKPGYEAAMMSELEQICTAIPHNELAIQWDVAIEFALLESVVFSYFESTKRKILNQLIELGNRVPADVELGYHLCYGDAEHKHFVEPKDTSLLVEVANAICAVVERPIQWIHMPVPRGRTDTAYFEPLRNLHLHPETKLYLGLVHYTDGVEGTQRRIAAAQNVISNFGIATECGMGRRVPDTIPHLLEIHRAVLEPSVG